jgi:hypothetical protein
MEQEEHHQHGELRTLKLELRREGGFERGGLICIDSVAWKKPRLTYVSASFDYYQTYRHHLDGEGTLLL